MIIIVDYGLGNLKSISNMLLRAGIGSQISADPVVIRNASKLILPGVGHFKCAIEGIRARNLLDALNERALEARVPVLGICLGAQLLGRRSEEGNVGGLNWVPMDTVAFDKSKMREADRLPHMGWADTDYSDSPLFVGMAARPRFYYVHSYHFHCDDMVSVICSAEHGYRFASGIRYRNIFGVQFHPEKSHACGQQVLTNFASMQAAG